MTEMMMPPQLPRGRVHNRPQLAGRRGITPVELVSRIVANVLDDNLVTAVLDDDR
jgi:hypothetical protein